MKGKRARFFFIALGVVAVVVIGLIAFAGPLVSAAIAFGGRLAGYDVRYANLANHDGHLTMDGLDVRAIGKEPLLSAGRIDVAYDLGHVFGGPSLYGISAIEIDRPRITIVHHRDGSYNFTLPPSNGSSNSAAPSIPKIHLIVRDGALGVVDDTRIFAHSRHLAVGDLQLDADVDPARVSHVTGGLAITEAGGTFPIAIRGTLDEPRGYELTRITARTLGLAPLIDYALNSTALHVSNGVLNDIDARIYGLPGRDGTMQRHISVTTNLDHFQPYLNGIAKPLRDGRGSLRVYDDGLAIPKVDGSIAGVPVRIAGAIYNLKAPVLRLGIAGNGDVRDLITLNDASKKLPLAGPVAFRLFVEGDAAQPTTLASFDSRGIAYGRIPIDAPSGLIVLHGPDTSILRSALGYDGILLGARGNLNVAAKHTAVDILANVDAPLGRLPYAATLVGPMRLYANAILSGVDSKLSASGVIEGHSPTSDLTGTVSVAADGTGSIGPIELRGPGARELYARIALDRPSAGAGAAFVDASDFSITTAGKQPALPGIALAPVPEVSGTFDAAGAGSFAGKRFSLGGDAHAYGFRALGYPIDDVTARVAAADGPRVDLDARYRGALAPLARAAGGTIVARGDVDVPISVVANGTGDVLAQIHDARFRDANVAGVEIEGLEGTARVRGKRVDVYGATATIDHHAVVADGSFGTGGVLDVSASGIDLASLRAAGLPVRAGDVAAVASITGSPADPHVDGGVAASDVVLANAAAAGLPIDANTGLTYDSGRLDVRDALVHAGSAVASLDGRIAGLRGNPKNATYAFDGRVRAADIATLARVAHANAYYPEGSIDADVAVAGTGSAPHVTGNVSVPEGSVNGLRFRNASVALAGGAAGIDARDGHVTVGSTVLGFDAAVSQSVQSAALRAPHIDLADFNDFFDTGDTVGGTGSLAVSGRNEPNRIVTSGRIRLAHTRFRRFDVGSSRADWSTSGHTVSTDVGVDDGASRVSESGDIVLPATQPLRDSLHRTSLALALRASKVDLDTWLPAVDVQAPVSGFVNATATVRGTYPRVALVAHADLQNGMAGRVAIRTATIDARAANGRATITSAVLAIDNLNATLTGSAGLEPQAPFDFTLTAQTPDVGALGKTVTGTTYDTSGSVRTVARATGTIARPSLTDTTDASRIRYGKYTVPSADIRFGLTRTRLTLDPSQIDLQDGRILASGFAPLRASPPGVGPPNAPLALDLTAERVDFAQFAPLLPKGTLLAGMLDGRVGLVGSLANPGLRGTLAVTNGSFVGPQEKSKIDDFVSQVTFSGRTATLHDTSAKVGGGTIALNGRVSVPDLTNPAQTASGSFTFASQYAVFDVPSLFKGRINGSVTAARAAGSEASVTGGIDVTSARIPPTALLPKAGGPASTATPLPVSLALKVGVGNDVRLQGGPVDIGAKGDLTVGGTIANPTVSGEIDSTGGTLSVYRTFNIQYPTTIAFDGTGVIPNVDALATTSVDNPPTDVTLHVTGPATQLNIDFESSPSYSREQIVGILVGAQALGAVSGLPNTPGQAPQQNPFQAVAEGQLGGLLTQNVLEPFSSQLGSAVGLNNLAINYSPGGGASLGAQKKILKNVNAVFAQSFNYPQRQSLGLVFNASKATGAQFTYFSQPSSNKFDTFEGAQSLTSTNNSVTDTQPASGSSGFSFSLQRKF